jgi:hypothetical protein
MLPGLAARVPDFPAATPGLAGSAVMSPVFAARVPDPDFPAATPPDLAGSVATSAAALFRLPAAAAAGDAFARPLSRVALPAGDDLEALPATTPLAEPALRGLTMTAPAAGALRPGAAFVPVADCFLAGTAAFATGVTAVFRPSGGTAAPALPTVFFATCLPTTCFETGLPTASLFAACLIAACFRAGLPTAARPTACLTAVCLIAARFRTGLSTDCFGAGLPAACFEADPLTAGLGADLPAACLAAGLPAACAASADFAVRLTAACAPALPAATEDFATTAEREPDDAVERAPVAAAGRDPDDPDEREPDDAAERAPDDAAEVLPGGVFAMVAVPALDGRDFAAADTARVGVVAIVRLPVPGGVAMGRGPAPEAAGLVVAFLAAGIEVFLLAND